MTSVTTKLDLSQPETETAAHLFDNWFDPVETGLQERVRGFLQEMLEAELDEALARARYKRRPRPNEAAEGAARITGHRHGRRPRSLLGTLGKVDISVPRARLNTPDGRTTEWKSQVLRTYRAARSLPTR